MRRKPRKNGNVIVDLHHAVELEGRDAEIWFKIKTGWSEEEQGTAVSHDLEVVTSVIFDDTHEIVPYTRLTPARKDQVDAALAMFLATYEPVVDDEPDEPEPTEDQLWAARRHSWR